MPNRESKGVVTHWPCNYKIYVVNKLKTSDLLTGRTFGRLPIFCQILLTNLYNRQFYFFIKLKQEPSCLANFVHGCIGSWQTLPLNFVQIIYVIWYIFLLRINMHIFRFEVSKGLNEHIQHFPHHAMRSKTEPNVLPCGTPSRLKQRTVGCKKYIAILLGI